MLCPARFGIVIKVRLFSASVSSPRLIEGKFKMRAGVACYFSLSNRGVGAFQLIFPPLIKAAEVLIDVQSAALPGNPSKSERSHSPLRCHILLSTDLRCHFSSECLLAIIPASQIWGQCIIGQNWSTQLWLSRTLLQPWLFWATAPFKKAFHLGSFLITCFVSQTCAHVLRACAPPVTAAATWDKILVHMKTDLWSGVLPHVQPVH